MIRQFRVGFGMVLLGLITASSAWAQEVVGVYECEGVNPDGSTYRGEVEISKDEDTYRVSWTMSERATALGIGILRGDVLAVSYFTGESLGVVAYRIEKGGQLVGEWAVLGAGGQLRPEVLSRRGLLSAQHQPQPLLPSARTNGSAAH